MATGSLRFDCEVPTCREGVFVPCAFATPEQVIDCIKHAERLGYEAVWATDFVTPTSEAFIGPEERPSWFEPMTVLAYAAAETERIRLGTGVLVLPYREPVILAKQAATLNRLSKGRFILGLGLGAWREEFLAIASRRGRAHRGRIAAEFTQVLRRLLDHDERDVSFDGEYIRLNNVNLDPKPLQRPLPFYMPGRNADALDRVARFGNGLMAAADLAAQRKLALESAADAVGRPIEAFDVLAEGELRLAATHEAAARDYESSRFGRYRASRGADMAKMIAGGWIGTVDEVVDKIGKVAEQGIRHFNVLHIIADTVQERMDQMQQFMEEVAPRLR